MVPLLHMMANSYATVTDNYMCCRNQNDPFNKNMKVRYVLY